MRKLKFSKSLIDVTKISGGTAVGQIILTVTLPFISRIYGAEILGIWTTITAISSIVYNVCDLGLTNALMVCPKERLAWIYGLIVKIAVIISSFAGIIVFLCKKGGGEPLNDSIMISCLVVVYAMTLCGVNLCSVVLNREQQYTALMINSILRFSVVAIVAISMGLLGWTKYGYFIANIMGQVITIFHMMRFMPKMQYSHKIEEVRIFIEENINFVRYQMPAAITITMRTELPNLLIGELFGNAMLGYYSISQKLLTIPVTFLGQSLGKVFFQKIAEMKRNGIAIGSFVERNINRGMVLALIPMTVLAAVGDVAVIFFFGSEYYVGGIICRIMVFRSLFNFISTSTQGIDIVLDKQQYVLCTCLIQTILSAGSVIMGYYLFDSIYITVLLIVTSFIVVQVGYFIFLYRVMKLNAMKYLRNIAFIIICMLVASAFIRKSVFFLLQMIPFEPINKLTQYF